MSIADQMIRERLAAKLAALPPIGVDLFCGAGGFGLGFHQAGFHMAAACEWDFWAAQTYLTNLGCPETSIVFLDEESVERWEKLAPKHQADIGCELPERWGTGWIAAHREDETVNTDPCEVFYFGDVRNLTGEMILRDLGVPRGMVSVVTGGPPCQGYSIAGKRQTMDPRNSLVFDFMRIVCEVAPKAFVMENVPGMLSMKTPEGVPVIDALSQIAADGGFSTHDAMKRLLTDMHAETPLASFGVRPQEKDRKSLRANGDEDVEVEADDPQMELAL